MAGGSGLRKWLARRVVGIRLVAVVGAFVLARACHEGATDLLFGELIARLVAFVFSRRHRLDGLLCELFGERVARFGAANEGVVARGVAPLGALGAKLGRVFRI